MNEIYDRVKNPELIEWGIIGKSVKDKVQVYIEYYIWVPIQIQGKFRLRASWFNKFESYQDFMENLISQTIPIIVSNQTNGVGGYSVARGIKASLVSTWPKKSY